MALSGPQKKLLARIKCCPKGYGYTPKELRSIVLLEKAGEITVAPWHEGFIAYPKDEAAGEPGWK